MQGRRYGELCQSTHDVVRVARGRRKRRGEERKTDRMTDRQNDRHTDKGPRTKRLKDSKRVSKIC